MKIGSLSSLSMFVRGREMASELKLFCAKFMKTKPINLCDYFVILACVNRTDVAGQTVFLDFFVNILV